MKMNDQQKQLIEKIGIFYEREGMQPVAARIIGLLLVSNETELTFDEIREQLNVSKSAASNAINLLLRLGQMDYITKPGERKRYFRNRMDQWKDAMKQKMDGMLSLRELLLEVKSVRSGKNKQFIEKLDELIDFMNYMHKEMPTLIKQWEAKRKK